MAILSLIKMIGPLTNNKLVWRKRRDMSLLFLNCEKVYLNLQEKVKKYWQEDPLRGTFRKSGKMLSEFASPILKADAFFALFLVGTEKLLEKEFTCPCSLSNRFFCYGLLVSSSFVIVFFTTLIQIRHYRKLQKRCPCHFFDCLLGICLSAIISLSTWLTVWYFDGHYYVCKRSTWEGVWTENSLRAPHKWCKPISNNTDSIKQLESISAKWSVESQVCHLYYYSWNVYSWTLFYIVTILAEICNIMFMYIISLLEYLNPYLIHSAVCKNTIYISISIYILQVMYWWLCPWHRPILLCVS